MTGGALERLFEPRSIAVVGASADPAKAGYHALAALSDFGGAIFAVNPRAGAIQGRDAYASLREVGARLDLAALAVPAEMVPAVLEDCAAAGVEAAVIFAGGFAESGQAGAALQARVAAIGREAGIRILGPNTSGFVNPGHRLCATFLPSAAALRPGGLAIVAQSGGVNLALAFAAHNRGVGIRLGVGLGNASDVDFADVLDYLAADEGTRAIALHVEGVADYRRLVAAIARAAERVPVIALRVGRADVADPAASHTGKLTGDWALTGAALRQAGAVVVETSGELIDAARALLAARLQPGRRPGVAVVTGQAGPALLAVDLLRAGGASVPELAAATVERLDELIPAGTYRRNPVDTGRPGSSFGAVIETACSDPGIAVALVYALQEPGALDLAAVREARRSSQTPLVFATAGPAAEVALATVELEAAGVPVYESPEAGARAVLALVADARAAERRRAAGAATPRSPRDSTPPLGPAPLDERAAKEVLAAIGIRVPQGRACASRDEARAAYRALGPPVVVKLLDAAVTHKTEVGGVHVGIADADALEAALGALEASGASRFLVEEQVERGVELIVGAVRRPRFGPSVLVGIGGSTAEAVGDVAVRLSPVTPADAEEMLAELHGAALLDGYRGLPPVSRGELAAIVCAIGGLLVDHPEIAEIEVNPLRATAVGLVALDALITLAEQDNQVR